MTSPTAKLNWRNHFAVHPAADLFPTISESELRWLGEDIKKNGLQQSLVIWTPDDKDDKREFLLDGRNRLDAASLLGILTLDEHGRLCLPDARHGELREIRYTHKTGGDPYALAVSLNIHRRHLTAEQKRELIGKLLKAQPESSDRSIATVTKVDHKTVGVVRTKLESTGEIPQLKKTVGKDGKSRRQPTLRSDSVKPTQTAADDSADERKALYPSNETASAVPTPTSPLRGFIARVEAVRIEANTLSTFEDVAALSNNAKKQLGNALTDICTALSTLRRTAELTERNAAKEHGASE